VWNSVPAVASLLQEHAQESDPRLRTLRLFALSGDRIPPALAGVLRRLGPAALTLMSLGGPTETTVWNIGYPIGAGDPTGTIPYGRPNANNRAYILDADGLDTPDWVTGEICAAGTGLARGYWGDEALTAARFRFDEDRGERLYHTGDLGRYLPDGNIDITGRADFQIKINGYRIEATEVETRLTAIPAVKQAVVVKQAGARGDRLVAHLAAAGAARPDGEQLRQVLREHLPEYMTPSAVVWYESLPLTPNGKVDRGALSALPPTATAPAGTARAGSPSALERALVDVWASVLRVPAADIALDTTFYDLGGDSLAAARVFTAVRKRFGVGITLDQLHEVPTIEALAARVTAAGGAARIES
jgi:acyl-coenzyme A synthetase/AMP-(fatty) acid ligase/acyl carrier protein